MEKSTIASVLKKVVSQLVEADYVSLYQQDINKRILPEEMDKAITDYPGTLTYPPDESFDTFEDYGAPEDQENVVEFTLWYDNEPSDLTLSITIHQPDRYALDDIRVM